MKNYKEFKVTTTPFNIDILSGILWELPIAGINEFDDHLLVFAEEDSEVSIEVINDLLNKLIENNIIEIFSVDSSDVENRNWNEYWEKRVNIVEVSDKIIIKPSFKEYTPKPGQVILEIDPKMSFGTGEHETTRLVLNIMDKIDFTGLKILDIGSGTGVLGICAAKLGAEKVICVDNDEWCLENGLENVKANKVEDIVEVKLGEISDISIDQFDFIIANINKHILLQISNEISSHLKNDGKVILSGLLRIDEEDILESYRELSFELQEKTFMNEWAALLLAK